jgi:hypothetical protein
VDEATTTQYGGTGLGLSIVQDLVRAHDSDIHVQSTVGVGTTFSFTLQVIHTRTHPYPLVSSQVDLGCSVVPHERLCRAVRLTAGGCVMQASDKPDIPHEEEERVSGSSTTVVGRQHTGNSLASGVGWNAVGQTGNTSDDFDLLELLNPTKRDKRSSVHSTDSHGNLSKSRVARISHVSSMGDMENWREREIVTTRQSTMGPAGPRTPGKPYYSDNHESNLVSNTPHALSDESVCVCSTVLGRVERRVS